MQSAPGQSIGRYRLLTRLAVGGMGEVFLAAHAGPEGFQKVVVVKRMLPSIAAERDLLRLFLDEARLVAKLSHRNIAQIFELGEDGDGYYVVMEYVKGPSTRKLLQQLVAHGQRMPPAIVIDIAAQVAEALAYAYGAIDDEGVPLRIIHRDVTPENILVSVSGDVKLIDFGVAKSAKQEHATQTGTLKGKLAYMSPEQSRSWKLDARSDLFSLGIVFCELLTGHNPFARSDVLKTVQAIQNDPPRLPSSFDPGLAPCDAFVRKLLGKSPDQRFADANRVYDELAALRASFPSTPRRLGPFVAEHFGREISGLIRSLSDPEAQRAMRSGSGGRDPPTPTESGATVPGRRAKTEDAEPAPRADGERAASSGDIHLVVDPAAAEVPAAAPPGPAFEPAAGGALQAILSEATAAAPRPLRRAAVAAGIAGVVALTLAIVASLVATSDSPNPPTLAPVTADPLSPPAAVQRPSPPASVPTSEERPAQAPAPAVPAPGVALAADPAPSPAPAGARTASGARPSRPGVQRKALGSRYRRVQAAWEAQKPMATENDVRVFDLALVQIEKLVAAGSADDLTEARRSLDDFVRTALRGVEP